MILRVIIQGQSPPRKLGEERLAYQPPPGSATRIYQGQPTSGMAAASSDNGDAEPDVPSAPAPSDATHRRASTTYDDQRVTLRPEGEGNIAAFYVPRAHERAPHALCIIVGAVCTIAGPPHRQGLISCLVPRPQLPTWLLGADFERMMKEIWLKDKHAEWEVTACRHPDGVEALGGGW